MDDINNQPPPGSLPLRMALERFGDPRLVSTWIEARRAVEKISAARPPIRIPNWIDGAIAYDELDEVNSRRERYYRSIYEAEAADHERATALLHHVQGRDRDFNSRVLPRFVGPSWLVPFTGGTRVEER